MKRETFPFTQFYEIRITFKHYFMGKKKKSVFSYSASAWDLAASVFHNTPGMMPMVAMAVSFPERRLLQELIKLVIAKKK